MVRILFFCIAMLTASGASAQQWADVPSAPKVQIPDHGVEVAIAAVYQSYVNITYIQIRERTIGTLTWSPVYGHQHAFKTGDDPVQFINSVLPAYNQVLAQRYPPLSSGPVFGTDPVGILNKALYESFTLITAPNGLVSIGLK